MYYVYILRSRKDQSYYTGFTEDLKERIKNHNWHTSSLKLRSTGEVRYTKSKALNFEKYLKQGSGFAFARKRLV